MAAIYYRIMKDGVEVNTYSKNGFYREFRFAVLDFGKEILNGVSIIRVNNEKETLVDFDAEVERLGKMEDKKQEKFESTHKQITIGTGVSHLNKRKIWVKK